MGVLEHAGVDAKAGAELVQALKHVEVHGIVAQQGQCRGQAGTQQREHSVADHA